MLHAGSSTVSSIDLMNYNFWGNFRNGRCVAAPAFCSFSHAITAPRVGSASSRGDPLSISALHEADVPPKVQPTGMVRTNKHCTYTYLSTIIHKLEGFIPSNSVESRGVTPRECGVA